MYQNPPGTTGGYQDICATAQRVSNDTATPKYEFWRCDTRHYLLPTPKPTTPPPSSPPPSSQLISGPKSANHQLNANEKVQSDSELLGYLNEYYANYQKEE